MVEIFLAQWVTVYDSVSEWGEGEAGVMRFIYTIMWGEEEEDYYP